MVRAQIREDLIGRNHAAGVAVHLVERGQEFGAEPGHEGRTLPGEGFQTGGHDLAGIGAGAGSHEVLDGLSLLGGQRDRFQMAMERRLSRRVPN
ncbi:MAG: hypothetical protein JWR00_2413 [Rubritepida sp.]|nr:hypothetical protein [Rubritepida sp.]